MGFCIWSCGFMGQKVGMVSKMPTSSYKVFLSKVWWNCLVDLKRPAIRHSLLELTSCYGIPASLWIKRFGTYLNTCCGCDSVMAWLWSEGMGRVSRCCSFNASFVSIRCTTDRKRHEWRGYRQMQEFCKSSWCAPSARPELCNISPLSTPVLPLPGCHQSSVLCTVDIF